MLHGREVEVEERTNDHHRRHMLTAPIRVNTSVVAGEISSPSSPSSTSSSLLLSPANSFFKDERKISVGDCALFKPPHDSPPFVGLIRKVTTGKENKLKLRVNWLYRPADIKLGKGILLEAAPNEIFYSFHKDEIPAASLLHPCKVAFLPKGVELPSGICSFVCRRVYDITNKRLWWLTDRDYINERQEVVDQLLSKTRLEMQSTTQPGGCSPKTMNGPTSTSQLKHGSDSVQNNALPFHSQSKGKKRERGDQGSEPVKRERFTKMDDVDCGHFQSESIWKSEIAKFTDKGGLVDSEGVEKLVHLMLPDRNEKKVDLVGRLVLAGVVAATDKFDCLNRFVQLRGLPVFDEWLQEAHKGKIGDCSSPKDNDKSVEEFLFVLLRALDKLPVNLHALQMCNIGKSVNHLRTHKNLEIQKKARSLVDTWKKRVEAEMDAKLVSNQPEVSPSGNRQTGISSEAAMKSSVVQLSTSKSGPAKLVQGDIITKAASSPGPTKSAASPGSVANSSKEGQPRNTGISGASDIPLTAARDEKSSSSSQSHNNSQSCSSDHARTAGFSGKEDPRSSTAGSVTASKIIAGSLRHRKSVNGFPGPALSGVQKETGSSRNSSVHRNSGSEKLQLSSLACEKALDVPIAEGNNHKFIVKIPNKGRSPARSSSGGTFEDPSVMNSRASSPVLLEKHDQLDRNLKEKNDTCRANIASDFNSESWQSNDFKEVLTGSDEGDGSPAAIPDEEQGRTADDSRKLDDISKATSSLTGYEYKSGKLHDSSFSPMNALIESCVKYSEANASVSGGDDVGMNLLASVAAGEMCRSDMVSSMDSPQRNTPVETCAGSDSRVKSSLGDDPARDRGKSFDGVDDEHEKRGVVIGISLAKSTEGKTILFSEEKPTGELNRPLNSSDFDVQKTDEVCPESNLKSEETVQKTSQCRGIESWEKEGCGRLNVDGTTDGKEKFPDSNLTEDKGSSSNPSREIDDEDKKNMKEELNISVCAEQKPTAIMLSESAKGTNREVLQSSRSGKDKVSENMDEVKAENFGETNDPEKQRTEHERNTASAVANQKVKCTEETPGDNQVNEQYSGPVSHKSSLALVQEPELVRSRGSKLIGVEGDETEECTSAAVDASSLSATGGSEIEAKVEFDLNEGFNVDDGKYGEPNNSRAPTCSTAAQPINPLALPLSSGLHSSITVAAAAKRPFVPPEDLLKNRGELGWKGSAATSAFRPAEPRKSLENPLGTVNLSPPDATAAKPSRPLLDIDLNVPDERIFEDLVSCSSAQDTVGVSNLAKNDDRARDAVMGSTTFRNSGGLDLDLNRVDEPTDTGYHLTSIGRRLDAPLHPVKSSSGVLLNGEVSSRRDFDLNDGPLVDEMSGAEPSPFVQHNRNGAPSQPSICGLRINSTEMGNFPSWFPQGKSYPAFTIQPILPDRGEQPFSIVAPGGPQRMLAPPTGSTPLNSDIYRGPVLSSSPAVPFPSTPFQYPVFPFGTNFPLSSATFSGGSTAYMDSSSGGRLCFPAVPSQVLAPTGAVPSHYPRPPYVVNLPDSNNNAGADSSRKWGRQGLDLNAGPLGPDIEGRDESSVLASRQLSLADEQSRIYQVTSGGVLKRKEPEGGWESYKQSSWQ